MDSVIPDFAFLAPPKAPTLGIPLQPTLLMVQNEKDTLKIPLQDTYLGEHCGGCGRSDKDA